MREAEGQLLPVYLLADESGSMDEYVGNLNAGMRSLHMALLREPMAAAKIRFSVLGFANSVTERLALADLRDEAELPRLSAYGGTNYEAAFDDLRTRIPRDVRTLKAQGYRVHRPAVFFLSDGLPNNGGDWREAHRRLTDRAQTPAAPNIVSFGIGSVDAATVLAVATGPDYAYVSVPGADLGNCIAGFFSSLTKSVVESGNSMVAGAPTLTVAPPEGFVMAIDEV
ncbi:vWA domain-containing protein [Streptomyces chilikensis]|uniref:vWA domain-containing protein n=1 Tax=Streptomyces chilikensis TaxID=1194079 RepID=UPI000A6D9F7D|nr:hypothetical protein [Streptomyces chilikensis]